MAGMTEDQLMAACDAEMRQAVGYWSGKLAMQRQRAMYFYLGLPKLELAPPEVEGRSQVVSPDVRNTIESMLPQLMVKFAGSDHPVEFEPTKPGDEQKAEQATDYVSYLYNVKNRGERVTYNWMKDALLSKNGIVKVWWDKRAEEKREEYVGLTQIELAQLMDDEEVEIIEQKSYADPEDQEQRAKALEQLQGNLQAAMQAQGDPQAVQAVPMLQAQIAQIQAAPAVLLYDVAVKRSSGYGCVRVENVPPEEFLISRKAKSIADAPFVGHRVARTMSELESMGYKDLGYVSGDDQATALNMERIERLAWDDELAYLNVDQPNTLDDSQRIVWVTECYIRVDFDGDGISELRKVVRAGTKVLENEVVDAAPFVSITPVPMPHKFFGMSVADLTIESQKIKTAILRGMLDNMFLQINGRYFAVDGQVNLDDLLTSRPGGVVRVKQPGAAGRLDQGMGDSNIGMSMMAYMQTFLEESAGWSRQSQGNDATPLTDPMTATQANLVANRADMRLDLIARNFAEGFRELYRMILKLVCQFQQREAVTKLRGQWVAINPREWRHGFECSINVGLGTGNKDQQVAHLMAMLQQQQLGLQDGTAMPANLYESRKELAQALGFKSGDKFFSDPRTAAPRGDPMQAQFQMTMAMERMKAEIKAQVETQAKQAELALERERMQLQAQVDSHRQEVEAQQKTLEMQQQRELDAAKHQQLMQLEQFKAQLLRETELAVAKINAEAGLVKAQVAAGALVTPAQDAAADAVLNDADDR